jgi:hypothetical protein
MDVRRTQSPGAAQASLAAALLVAATAVSACGLHGNAPAGESAPQPRLSASMAFDVRAGQMLLFGGAAERSLGDTWAWQNGGWQRLDPPTSPPARENAALGYDRATGELVLFGGDSVTATSSNGAARNDTWTWDGSTWTQRHPRHQPPATETPRLADDEARGVLLLVTQPDYASSNLKGMPDMRLAPVLTWTWRNGDWHAESSTSAPLAHDPGVGGRSGLADDGIARPVCCGTDFSGTAGMSWDPVSRRILYVEHVVEGDAPLPPDGLVTWSWGGAWRLEHPAHPPGDSPGPLLAADRTGVVLVDESGHTWHWNGSTWSPVATSGPGRRDAAAAAYDQSARVVRLFGGIADQPGGVYGDTWTWDGTAWSRSAGTAHAQAVPQIAAVKPAHGISREQAVAIAVKASPFHVPVTRVENGPEGRFDSASVGSAGKRVWVWAVVFGAAEVPSQGPCGEKPLPGSSPYACPPPARGYVEIIDYQSGAVLFGMAPAPDWLLATPSPG